MGLNVGMTQKIGVVGVILYVALRSIVGHSADELPANSGFKLGGTETVGGQLPTTFDPAIYQNMQNMFTGMNGCVNLEGQLNQMKDIITKGPQNNVKGAQGGACTGRDDVSEIPSECRAFGKDWEAQQKGIEAYIEGVKKIGAVASCKKGKIDSLNQELSCLYTQAGALKAQLSALNDSYKNNIQKMETDYAQIKAVEEDRVSQLEFLNSRLNGDKESGAKGVRQLAAETKDMIAKMNADIQAAKEKFKSLDAERVRVEELSVNRAMELTNTCFSVKTNSSFRCEPNGPPVSARDYVLCRFEQNQRLGQKGVLETSNTVAAQAKSKRQALETLLNAIIGDSAQISGGGGKDANGQPLPPTDKPVSIRSYDDIQKQIGDKLGGYNGKGLDIQAFVLAQYKSCYGKSESVVATEKTQNNTELGRMRIALNAEERNSKAFVNGLVESYAQQYNENIAGLTGANLPLDANRCKDATPARQANCLTEMQSNMEGLYDGTSVNSQMRINLPARDANLAATLTCQGLKGCLTTLENAYSGVKKEKERVTKFKQDYALRAKQNVQNFTSTMAKTLSGQSGELRSKLQTMSNTLKSLGIRPMRVKDIETEQLEIDEETKLPKVPKNVMGLVGSQMNPKMPDLDGEQFKEELDQVMAEGKKFDDKVAKATSAEAKLTNKLAECQKEDVEKSVTKLRSEIDSLNACYTNADFCKNIVDGSNSTVARNMDDSIEALKSMGGDVNQFLDLAAALTQGRDDCDNTVKERERLENEIKDLEKNKVENATRLQALYDTQRKPTGEKSTVSCGGITSQIRKLSNSGSSGSGLERSGGRAGRAQ